MQLQMKSSELQLRWLPRLQNVEADRLTNGDFTGFSDRKRLRFSVDEFSGVLLSDMLELGSDLYGTIREAKAKANCTFRRLAEKTSSSAEILGCRFSWILFCASQSIFFFGMLLFLDLAAARSSRVAVVFSSR